jgi:segregation and condensation protein A
MSSVLQKFLGPIDALITQVQERTVDLFDINLTELARKFQCEGTYELQEGAKFIAGLSHLMYLKAVKLVPQEEKVEVCDCEPETELFVQEYSSFKQVAELFSRKEKEQSYRFARKPLFEVIPPLKPVLSPPISLDEFSRLFSQILEQAEKRHVTISDDSYHLHDVLDEVRKRLKKGRILFTDLFNLELGKLLLISTFLAVLELMKNQEARLISENSLFFVEKAP